MMTWQAVPFEILKGQYISKVIGLHPGSDEVRIVLEDEREFRMRHDQSCCERVEVVDVAGSAANEIHGLVALAEEVSSNEPQPGQEPPTEFESYTWTFYKLVTNKGEATIRWLGTSNGYYSESVDFEELVSHGDGNGTSY